MFLGVDIGLQGGLVLIDEQGKVLEKHITPIKTEKKNIIDIDLFNILVEGLSKKTTKCFVEKVHAMPKQGVCSMFSFGEVFGITKALLQAHDIDFTLVTPNAWTKKMFTDIPEEITGKNRARYIFQRDYPNECFKATPRSKTPHSGLVDALLIAEYGRLYL